MGKIDLAHATATDKPFDNKRTDFCAGRKRAVFLTLPCINVSSRLLKKVRVAFKRDQHLSDSLLHFGAGTAAFKLLFAISWSKFKQPIEQCSYFGPFPGIFVGHLDTLCLALVGRA